MHDWERILYSVVNPDEDLGETISTALDNQNESVAEFSDRTGVSESLLYKITSGHRTNIQLDNLETIVVGVKRLEQGREENERVVALVSNREALEQIPNTINVDGIDVRVRGYPSSTVEEAIRQSILAERDGVDAIVCGPITAYTIENILYTPVIGLDILPQQLEQAIERAILKTTEITDD